ncbi:MAG: chorismate synthase [Candidatus Heritagella sp.]|nr:chorismate synthase [Candidatus Heritagella sp.]
MSSTFGKNLHISVFGGSHTEAIGVVIDGLPAGETIDQDALLRQMARRAPGRDKSSTPRKESDIPRVLCGLLDGVTTGAPLCLIIENTNIRSKDYSDLKIHPRPGHADYTAFVRYGGHNDIRGGGHFSGRLTACLVAAGGIARQILQRRGILIGAHALQIGPVFDRRFDPVSISPEELIRLSETYFALLDPEKESAMRDVIEEARMAQDSIGGIVECAVTGLPAGLGSPMFDGVENVLGAALFGVPAVKGVEFGDGFGVAALHGSENNDPFTYGEDGKVKTLTNHAGGVLGGITTGMPLVFRCAVKPTSSISRAQHTIDLSRGCDDTLSVHGRHDPCIVPRAIPVVEGVAAMALLDMMSGQGLL